MVELKWQDGDLVPNGAGDFCRLEGSQALIQRVLFKLTVREGSFPFLPWLGSRLHTLVREKPAARAALCRQYVQQALKDEDVNITDVEYTDGDGRGQVKVYLQWQGQPLEVTAQIGGNSHENNRCTVIYNKRISAE